MKPKTIAFSFSFGLAAIFCLLYFGWPWYAHEYRPIENAKERVAADLLDASSAKFRNVSVYGLDTVCGEVNAKNAFGAYVGFRWFWVIGKVSSVAEGPEASVPSVVCRNKR